MTAVDDPYAADVPWRVTGLLATAESLTAADVHVARRLGAIGGEDDERVLLAAALAVQALRSGSVCVVLDDVRGRPAGWHEAVRRSPLVADGPDGPADRPLRWVDGRVYLDRYWRDEQTVRAAMRDRLARAGPARPGRAVARRSTASTRRPPTAPSARRSARPRPRTSRSSRAARAPARRRPSPAWSPRCRPPPAPVCASRSRRRPARRPPACRRRSTRRSRAGSRTSRPSARCRRRRCTACSAGVPGTTTRFRHDRLRRLPHDVVIVDESSMVSLSLMARLVDALRPTARLVLVGDPDQLASVEAGAVLGDLVAALPGGVVRLTHAHRYGPSLAALAEAIRLGDADTTLALLRSGDEHRSLVEPTGDRLTPQDVAGLRADIEAGGAALVDAARAGDAAAALRALGTHRLLRRPPRGPVRPVATGPPPPSRGPARAPGPWPLGRPLLVTENDRASGLYNGDTGVVISDGLRRRRRRVRRARRPAPRPPAPPARRPARPRDDRPPRPGQPVRPRDPPAPAGHLAAAHPRAPVHGGHPRPRARPRHRHARTPSAPPSRRPVRRASGLREPR